MSADKTALIVGAGDYIGSAIARRFAREGFTIVAGRRNGDKLAPLVESIGAGGGRCHGLSLDARSEEGIKEFFARAESIAPIELVVFNVGGNVNFPILDTTERVFRKVWELGCYAGFLTGREAAGYMVPRGRGTLFFTGATASLRGGVGYAAFASAKFGLRAVAQSIAREIGPKGIHVAHLIIDAAVDTGFVRQLIAQQKGEEFVKNLPPDVLMDPDSIAEAYWHLYRQPRDAWTFEMDLRPYGESW